MISIVRYVLRMLQLHWTCADIKINEEFKKRLLIGNKESSNIEDASLIIGLHPYLITLIPCQRFSQSFKVLETTSSDNFLFVETY